MPTTAKPPFLKTFFNYYGGKWRIAPRYPAPRYNTIIEPFAGAAGYSLRHYQKEVVLIDADPTIVGIWRFLIAAEPDDILRLPVIGEFATVDEIDAPQGAKDMIGFCVNAGAAKPCKTPAKWACSPRKGDTTFWNISRRARVAEQVPLVKHWRVIHGTYKCAEDAEATWFIDPPYQGAQGAHYRKGSGGIDYQHLAEWCRSRAGQVMVCEGPSATWMPFRHFHDATATPKGDARVSREFIWTNEAG